MELPHGMTEPTFALGRNGALTTGRAPGWTSGETAARAEPSGRTIEETPMTFAEPPLRVTECVARFPGIPLLERWIEVRTTGAAPVTLDRVDTLQMRLAPGDYRLRWYRGTGTAEFQPQVAPLEAPVTIETTSGRSCNGAHPWFGLEDGQGRILCGAIAWPGNHVTRIEKDGAGWTLSAGLHDAGFSVTLAPGETFSAPSVLLATAEGGDWDAAARAFHQWARRFGGARSPLAQSLPVEWNHWWPYDDRFISEEVFRANAEAAARMGVDVVTLDAGWFGASGETHWWDVRGDWDTVNRERFPHGIRALSDHAHGLGLTFGLWCEIEAIGKAAALNGAHPELVARRDGEPLGYLCFGGPAARDWALETLEGLIADYALDWVKIDFNADPGLGCNETGHGHASGDGLYRHIRGLFEVVDRLRERRPDVLIEACASGGLRLDLGTLEHFDTIFLSDPDYPVHNLQVFWGALDYLPPDRLLHWCWSETTAGWASFDPRDPTLTPERLDYAIRTSLLGMSGLSQKLPEMPAWVRDSFARHFTVYKERLAPLVREADVYRLTGQPTREGGGDRWCAFQYHRPEDASGCLFAFRLPSGAPARTLILRGLDPARDYRLAWDGAGRAETLPGAALLHTGLTLDDLPEEGSALLFYEPA